MTSPRPGSRLAGRRPDPTVMPQSVTPHVGWFDRFAHQASMAVSRAWFFSACVLLVVLWAPSYFVLRDLNLYQLLINTGTTIITFLLVALLQNSQQRADQALQHKLNAIADALSDLMCQFEETRPDTGRHVAELRAAVGLEKRESS